ncbi:MAG: toxin-activating lysine-acyltransferase [Mesorhizobium sp.]
MVRLCVSSGTYLEWSVTDLGRLFLPPVMAWQFKPYFEHQHCVAFATWAFLSEEWSDRLRFRFEDPSEDAWSSGPHLWIVDVVAPQLGALVARDLRRSVFRHHAEQAFALRRDGFGHVRRVARWAPAWQCEQSERCKAR